MLALAAALAAGCGGDGGRGSGSPAAGSPPVGTGLPVLDEPFDEVEYLLEDAGLEVCEEHYQEFYGGSDLAGSYDSTSFRLDTSCSEDPLDWAGYLSVDLYRERSRAAAELVDPSTNAYLTWLVDPTTMVSTTQDSDPALIDALNEAFSDYPARGPHF